MNYYINKALSFLAPYKMWIYIAGGILLLILIVAFYQSCLKKDATIDLDKLQQINSKNEKARHDALVETVKENQDVVTTVDNRTTISNTETADKNKEIDAKVAEAEKQVAAAKAQGRDVTQSELKCILIPENCLSH